MSSSDAAPLHSLTYRSTACRPLSAGELEHLLAGSRRRNADLGITGLLLYVEGRFLQYLEGPREGLAIIFSLIQASPLHEAIVDVEWRQVVGRVYGDWSMAFLADTDAGIPNTPQQARGLRALEEQAGLTASPGSNSGQVGSGEG